MNKVPPFISYDYHPLYVTIFGEKRILRHPSIRALAKDGTIWETNENENGQWQAWMKIGRPQPPSMFTHNHNPNHDHPH